MLEIIEFRRPTESRKNLYITNIANETGDNELTVNSIIVIIIIIIISLVVGKLGTNEV